VLVLFCEAVSRSSVSSRNYGDRRQVAVGGNSSAHNTLSAERPNVERSMEVIRLLLPLYGHGAEVETISQHILTRFKDSERMLRIVYAKPENNNTDAVAFLFQPAAMMIYDCLLTDRDLTLKHLNERFPSEELARVATLSAYRLIRCLTAGVPSAIPTRDCPVLRVFPRISAAHCGV
jgi:hypothetical protein